MGPWPTFCKLLPVGGHQTTDCSQQCWVPQGHCPRLSDGVLQTNTNLKILPADKSNATLLLNTIVPNQKIGDLLQDPAYRRLVKDPTQAVTRKNILFLKKTTLAEEVCKWLIPRVQNPRGHVDSSTFVKSRSLLGRTSRRHTAASVESWPHTSRVLICHQGTSPAFPVLWRPIWVWGFRMYTVWVWPGVQHNTGHNKKFFSLYCSPYIIMFSE
jgi:hypothetical protein